MIPPIETELERLGLPAEFQVYHHTVKVVLIPDHPEVGKYGDWDADKNEIRLFTNGVCDDVVIHAFYHELAHCLVERTGRSDLSSDETFVDTLGGILAQYTTTCE